MLTINTTKDTNASAVDDPISHMEDLGESLLQASQALHSHARSIALNAQQTESILSRPQS